MRELKYQDIESIAIVFFALVFYFWEARSPRNRNLPHSKHLKTDLAAFLLIILGVNLSREIVSLFYDSTQLRSFRLGDLSAAWPLHLRILCAHLVADFCLYWLHRGMHTWDFLWRTHRFHHSAESLYWFSGFRTSFLHIFLYAFPQVLVGMYLFHFTSLELGIAFSLGALSQFFTHANIRVPDWLPLHYVLVTPEFHHPHHSQLGTQNRNFGAVFTIWDRFFGTYVDPKKIRQDFAYGLKEKTPLWRMMIGL